MSSTDFYRAFEERYRGSRELIRQRLQAYAPFIGPLRSLYQPAPAIDLGCGRGEWLELLQDAGFQPHGVDLDAGMLAACTERGLPVTQGDAIAYLQALGDASQCIVSGFHLAEHMAFSDLETLVSEALRVLKPGGTLSSLGVYSSDLTIPLSAFAAGLGDHAIVTALCPGGKERMRRLMNVLASGRLDLGVMVTHHYKLENIVEAYELFSHQRDGVLKIAIKP